MGKEASSHHIMVERSRSEPIPSARDMREGSLAPEVCVDLDAFSQPPSTLPTLFSTLPDRIEEIQGCACSLELTESTTEEKDVSRGF